jgi:adenylosuccinate lyase
MPHKRNPVKCEQLCGLARVLRGYVVPGLEDVALWHERDISHSSVERIVFPDAFQLAHYMTVRFRAIVADMTVDTDRMLSNLESTRGLVFSQPVLLALVESGMTRDDAYRAVQRNAMAASEQAREFRDVLHEDPEVTGAVSSERLDQCFDLPHALEHASHALDAL